MDAGLDNANATNNPFANSNGTEILSQKEGFLLNLSEGFKQNGSEISPTNEYLFERSTNGKRSAEDEFDEDEDMGPETDIDAVDDISLSPSTEHTTKTASENKVDDTFDPFATDLEEKVALELDLNLQKQQSSEFDSVRTPREETPTPPADEVHDVGVEDNVGDSGEDSEDEWNYYKGDAADKETISKADQEVAEITQAEEDSEKMSQLNPDAAEFVPISSPTRSTASPACRGLVNDTVIAQSPRRVTPTEIDINLPNPQEFEKEVKSRPSDVYSNGDESDPDHKLTSQEVMENFLNGKNIDDIEFHPSTPSKYPNPEEFHFGPNAAPFSTPSKVLDQSETALSTKAVFGEESAASYLEGKSLGFENSFSESNLFGGEDVQDFQSLQKERDPMSASFYQDKDDESNNPFDLNKVQVLPDNIDDYLLKQGDNLSMNETISDLPEHDPMQNIEVVVGKQDTTELGQNAKQLEEVLDNTDLSTKPESFRALSRSPVPADELLGSKTPDMLIEADLEKGKIFGTETDKYPSLSPVPLSQEAQTERPQSYGGFASSELSEVCEKPNFTVPVEVLQLVSSPTPEVTEESCRLPTRSPVETGADLLTSEAASEGFLQISSQSSPLGLTPEPTELTPEPSDGVCRLVSKSPITTVQETSAYPQEPAALFSEQFALSSEPSVISPDPMALTPEPNALSPEPSPLSPEPATLSPKLTTFSTELGLFHSDPVLQTLAPTAFAPEPTVLTPELTFFSSESADARQFSAALSPEPSAPSLDLIDDVYPSKSPTDLCNFPSKSPFGLESGDDLCQLPSKSPIPVSPEPAEGLCQLSSKSPVSSPPEPSQDLCQIARQAPVTLTPEPARDLSEELTGTDFAAHIDACRFVPRSPELVPAKSPTFFEGMSEVRDEIVSPELDADLVCDFPSSKSPQMVSSESPVEDVTSSVKDDVVSPLTSSPVHDVLEEVKQIVREPILETNSLNFAQELSNAVQESMTNEMSSPLEDKPEGNRDDVLETSAQIDAESVATADVNSFLERSNVSGVTSPLSPNEPPLQEQYVLSDLNHPLSRCVLPLPDDVETIVVTKREIIEPEYPIEEVVSPSEESRTPLSVAAEKQKEAPAALTEVAPEANKDAKVAVIAAAGVAVTVAAVAGVAAAVCSENDKKPAKTIAASKKPTAKTTTSPVKSTSRTATSKSSATSPTKPGIAATTRLSKPAASSKPTTPSSAKPALAKTSATAAAKPTAKPKFSPSTAAKPTESSLSKATEKKPLTNGDVKSSATRTNLIKKTSSTTTSSAKTSITQKSPATKLSPTKTAADSKPAALTRPATAPAKTARTIPTSTPKPRPTTLTAKTTTTTTTSSSSATKTGSTVPTARSTTLTKTNAATSPKSTAAKPRPATAAPRPKVPLTKPSPKGPDTEKQLKETANKQLSAGRTTTTSASKLGASATARTTTTVRKTETKAPGTRTIMTKTTVTTIKSAKKPLEIIRNAPSKTKASPTKTTTTKVEQNGLTNGITVLQETTAIISHEPPLVKDLSPVETKLIIDNSQLPETNIAD